MIEPTARFRARPRRSIAMGLGCGTICGVESELELGAGGDESGGNRPTGILWYAQTFVIGQQTAVPRYVIEDSGGNAVAFLPSDVGGHVRTRESDWTLSIERRRGAWAVIARDPLTGAEVAGVRESWLPITHVMWVGDDASYRLREGPLSGIWSLSFKRRRLATISLTRRIEAFSIAYPATWRSSDVGSITTREPTLASSVKLDLPIILAVELIKAKCSIGGGGGGGG